MNRSLLLFLSLGAILNAAEPRAKNVILFLGDAGGASTLNAASAYGHNRPQALFIQQMPHLALSDTSALNRWVTDSAAGMTAIVTGHKTNNGMLSAVPGATAEELVPVKTILEYAEEHGLSTGVVTNMPIWDATPGACYAHVGSRSQAGEIFAQLLQPRFGDGADVVVGRDWKRVVEASAKLGTDAAQGLAQAGYQFYAAPADIPTSAKRAAAIYDGGDFVPAPVVANVLEILRRNPKGFFLMVEWDMHTDNIEKGLKRVLVMDDMIRRVAAAASEDTLIIYAADHSFDVRMVGGTMEKPVTEQLLVAEGDQKSPTKPVYRVNGGHTGEEILVAAQGPGAQRLHGFIPNTAIFHLMMDAYGWPETP